MEEGWGGRNNFERIRVSSKSWGKDINKLTAQLFLSFPVKTDFNSSICSFVISTNISQVSMSDGGPRVHLDESLSLRSSHPIANWSSHYGTQNGSASKIKNRITL